jgi:hypothetical protein
MAADRAWPRSVRVRTTAAAVGVLGVALLLCGVALVAGLRLKLDRDLRAGAMLRASEVARLVGSGADLSPVLAGDDAVQVLGAAGEVVAASTRLAGRPPIARLAAGQSRTVVLPSDDDSYLVVAASAGDRTVLLARSRDDVAEATQALTVLLGIGLPLLLLVVGATTWRWWEVRWRRWTLSGPRSTPSPRQRCIAGCRCRRPVTRSTGSPPP